MLLLLMLQLSLSQFLLDWTISDNELTKFKIFIQRMIGFGKLPKYHQDPTAEELTKTLDCWPSMNYYITACKYVSMSSFQKYL
jgi:hypothetical protein